MKFRVSIIKPQKNTSKNIDITPKMNYFSSNLKNTA